MSGRPEFAAGKAPPPRPASQEEISASPLWHLYDYDLAEQTFTLMRIEEELYREASFLDHRIAAYNCPMVRYEMRHMARMFPRLRDDRGPMRFIFHVGHCGSTLLSRALGVSQQVLPFREPMSLRSLSTDHRELDTPMSFLGRPAWEWLLPTIVDSLARRFRPEQVNIVKATSTGNNLIVPILEEDDSHRAVLQYVPLEVYLATMLRKKKGGSDLRGQARTRMQDWMRIESEPGFSLHELRAPHLAVLSWLTSMHYMLAAHEAYGDRVRMLDFEELISDPKPRLSGVATLFGLQEESDDIVERFPEVASGYSKQPERRYNPEARAQQLQRTRDIHAEEIRKGLEWAESLIYKTPGLEDFGDYLL